MAQININRSPQPPRIPRDVVTEDDTPHRTLSRPTLPHQQNLLLLLLANLRRRARIRYWLRRGLHLPLCVEVEDNELISGSRKLGLAPRLSIDTSEIPKVCPRCLSGRRCDSRKYAQSQPLVILHFAEKNRLGPLPAIYPRNKASRFRLPGR